MTKEELKTYGELRRKVLKANAEMMCADYFGGYDKVPEEIDYDQLVDAFEDNEDWDVPINDTWYTTIDAWYTMDYPQMVTPRDDYDGYHEEVLF